MLERTARFDDWTPDEQPLLDLFRGAVLKML
jgi:hypothetical protein